MKAFSAQLQTLTAACLLCLAHAVFAAAPDSKSDTLEFVSEPFPPFTFEQDGQASGPMVEAVQAMCEEAKLKCSMSVQPWRRTLKSAEDGEVDGIFPIAPSAERSGKFFLSDAIIATSYSFFAPKSGHWSYGKPADLNGMTVGVYGPSNTAKVLKELASQAENATVVVELNNYDVLKKLTLGYYGDKAAAMINREVGLQLLKQEKFDGAVLAGDAQPVAYVLGLSRQKSNAAQMEKLNAALRKLKASGKLKTILARHGLSAPKD